jgi:transcriptional regulator with XRE-family HTH domain
MVKVARPVSANVQPHFDELGTRLKGARIERRISLVEMANRTGISRDTLHRLERGDPSISIAALLNVLGVLGLEAELDQVAARFRTRREARPIDPQVLIDFAERDWSAVTALKTAAWLKRRQRLGPRDSFRISDDLRRHVRTTRPDWPGDDARAADIESHIALGESLRRVGTV